MELSVITITSFCTTFIPSTMLNLYCTLYYSYDTDTAHTVHILHGNCILYLQGNIIYFLVLSLVLLIHILSFILLHILFKYLVVCTFSVCVTWSSVKLPFIVQSCVV